MDNTDAYLLQSTHGSGTAGRTQAWCGDDGRRHAHLADLHRSDMLWPLQRLTLHRIPAAALLLPQALATRQMTPRVLDLSARMASVSLSETVLDVVLVYANGDLCRKPEQPAQEEFGIAF